jgi:exopolysaccharide biosynthesis predicted pyruvyltransferase EpsI
MMFHQQKKAIEMLRYISDYISNQITFVEVIYYPNGRDFGGLYYDKTNDRRYVISYNGELFILPKKEGKND